MSSWIPQGLYDEIIKNVPIVCVDILIWYQDHYLLVKRNREPAKGQYWFPGGRIHKGELAYSAALRIAMEEVGLDCSVRKSLGFYETIFDKSTVENHGIHSVNLCYLLHSSTNKVKLDSTSDEYQWVPTTRSPLNLDPRLKNFIDEVFGEY